mmetsp:Transcript_74914/g.175808  ORF Transcript_74914/g.175808 Transcript_74914/m.175808 type:complete len:202 (-) Transcript_74914:651-1256(-)
MLTRVPDTSSHATPHVHVVLEHSCIGDLEHCHDTRWGRAFPCLDELLSRGRECGCVGGQVDKQPCGALRRPPVRGWCQSRGRLERERRGDPWLLHHGRRWGCRAQRLRRDGWWRGGGARGGREEDRGGGQRGRGGSWVDARNLVAFPFDAPCWFVFVIYDPSKSLVLCPPLREREVGGGRRREGQPCGLSRDSPEPLPKAV